MALTLWHYTTAHAAMEGCMFEDIVRQDNHPLAAKFWLSAEDLATNLAEAANLQVNLHRMYNIKAVPKDKYLRDFQVHVLKHFLLMMRRRYPKLVCALAWSCPSPSIVTSFSDSCPARAHSK